MALKMHSLAKVFPCHAVEEKDLLENPAAVRISTGKHP
jgi:hypothetical protein